MTAPLTLSQRFAELDRLLCCNRHFWQLRSFELMTPPWHDSQLQSWLISLSSIERQRLLNDDKQRAQALTPFIPQAEHLLQLCQVDSATSSSAETNSEEASPAWLSYHIPGRKWSQICAFDQALYDTDRPFIEWCAGKGHLGRLLAHRHQQPVTSLELQPQLCQHGQQLADQRRLPCTHHAIDVMSSAASQQLQPEQHAVALHACGKLHIRLLEEGVKHGVKSISLSPCCYHLIDLPDDQPSHPRRYQPLSQIVATSALRLNRDDLGLAVQETVTAGAREQRLRQQQLSWRLGFDLLQRQIRGIDRYLNCPTIPQSRLSGSFTEFCHWMAERKQLSLPAGIDFEQFEQRGLQRVQTTQQIELVQQLFRRPLELWLVLDRALYLQQHGYQVTLQQFCSRQLTPRNLLIQARQ
ncbi:MAG: methyltransferase [Motiliproteus sp.]